MVALNLPGLANLPRLRWNWPPLFVTRIHWGYSPSSTRIASKKVLERRKSVERRSSNIGLAAGIMPRFFAPATTPKVPVKASPRDAAIFLARKSSKMSKESAVSTASAIDSASPGSMDSSSAFFNEVLVGVTIRHQSGNSLPNSDATIDVTMIWPYISCNKERCPILSRTIRQDVSEMITLSMLFQGRGGSPR